MIGGDIVIFIPIRYVDHWLTVPVKGSFIIDSRVVISNTAVCTITLRGKDIISNIRAAELDYNVRATSTRISMK